MTNKSSNNDVGEGGNKGHERECPRGSTNGDEERWVSLLWPMRTRRNEQVHQRGETNKFAVAEGGQVSYHRLQRPGQTSEFADDRAKEQVCSGRRRRGGTSGLLQTTAKEMSTFAVANEDEENERVGRKRRRRRETSELAVADDDDDGGRR